MYNLSADYMYHIIIRSKNQCQSDLSFRKMQFKNE